MLSLDDESVDGGNVGNFGNFCLIRPYENKSWQIVVIQVIKVTLVICPDIESNGHTGYEGYLGNVSNLGNLSYLIILGMLVMLVM